MPAVRAELADQRGDYRLRLAAHPAAGVADCTYIPSAEPGTSGCAVSQDRKGRADRRARAVQNRAQFRRHNSKSAVAGVDGICCGFVAAVPRRGGTIVRRHDTDGALKCAATKATSRTKSKAPVPRRRDGRYKSRVKSKTFAHE